MKKRILVLAAIFGASASFAQVTSLKNKKGFEILPEAGDYAIQFDATPMLDFAVNAVKMGANGTQTAGGTATYVTGFNNTIVGKYFVDASTAYRAKVGINTNSTKTTVTIPSIADPEVTAEQINTTKYTQIMLGGGMEWRRGHNRLQGFYGAEALITIGSLTPATDVEYSEDLNVMVNDYGAAYSTETTNKRSLFGLGLRGFVGVEYFVLPKISLGAEFGWGLGFTTGKTEVNTRTSDGTTITEATTAGPKQSVFGFTNDISNNPAIGGTGNIVATFHF